MLKTKAIILLACLALAVSAAPDRCNECYSCISFTNNDDGEDAADFVFHYLSGMSDDMFVEHIMNFTYDGVVGMSSQYSCNPGNVTSETGDYDGWPCMAIEFTATDSENENMVNCRILANALEFIEDEDNLTDSDITELQNYFKNKAMVGVNLLESIDADNAPFDGLTVSIKSCLTDDCNALDENQKQRTSVQCGLWDDSPGFLEDLEAGMELILQATVDAMADSGCVGFEIIRIYKVIGSARRQRRSTVEYAAVEFDLEFVAAVEVDTDALATAYGDAIVTVGPSIPGFDIADWQTEPTFETIMPSSATQLTVGVLVFISAIVSTVITM